MNKCNEWVILKLSNRIEVPLWDVELGYPYLADSDFEDGRLFFGFSTKKEALEQIKIWKWCDRLLGKRYRYYAERIDKL